MNNTAATQMAAPMNMFVVMSSLYTTVPMNIAVRGSNTPRTDVLVAPMFLVEMARVRRDTIVGKIPSASRLPQSAGVSIPFRRLAFPVAKLKINKNMV